jgi:hypothetical protein
MSAVFIADISGLLELIANLGLLRRYDELRKEPKLPERLFFSSQEDYFTTFENNSGSIGFLRPQTAGELTLFYVYLKAARDLQRRLEFWDKVTDKGRADLDKIKKDIDDIFTTMQQCAVHGLKALTHLGEDTAKITALRDSLGLEESFSVVKGTGSVNRVTNE